MSNKLDWVFGIGGCAVGLIGLGYALGTRNRFERVCNKIDKSIDEIADNIEVDIVPDKLIDKAIDKAINREVEKEVGKAIDKAIKDVKYDIHRDVERAIKNEYNDIKTKVSDEISKTVSNMDMKDFEAELKKKAQAELVKKFDHSLDNLLGEFSGNLKMISRVYGSVQNAITGGGCNNSCNNNNSGFAFRLN